MNELLENGIVKRINYPIWLANAVVVPKHNGEWLICIDYADLNSLSRRSRSHYSCG